MEGQGGREGRGRERRFQANGSGRSSCQPVAFMNPTGSFLKFIKKPRFLWQVPLESLYLVLHLLASDSLPSGVRKSSHSKLNRRVALRQNCLCESPLIMNCSKRQASGRAAEGQAGQELLRRSVWFSFEGEENIQRFCGMQENWLRRVPGGNWSLGELGYTGLFGGYLRTLEAVKVEKLLIFPPPEEEHPVNWIEGVMKLERAYPPALPSVCYTEGEESIGTISVVTLNNCWEKEHPATCSTPWPFPFKPLGLTPQKRLKGTANWSKTVIPKQKFST